MSNDVSIDFPLFAVAMECLGRGKSHRIALPKFLGTTNVGRLC